MQDALQGVEQAAHRWLVRLDDHSRLGYLVGHERLYEINTFGRRLLRIQLGTGIQHAVCKGFRVFILAWDKHVRLLHYRQRATLIPVAIFAVA